MVRRIENVERFCIVDDAARKLLLSVERPIVLLPRKPEAPVAGRRSAAQSIISAFFCLTRPSIIFCFRRRECDALVMTSANLSEEPIAIDNDEAVERLRGIADGFLVHNRDILRRCDDSVVASRGRPNATAAPFPRFCARAHRPGKRIPAHSGRWAVN